MFGGKSIKDHEDEPGESVIYGFAVKDQGSEDFKLLYVGKAASFEARLSSHLDMVKVAANDVGGVFQVSKTLER